VLATFARGIVFEPLIGHLDGAQFDAPKFNWIGSVSNEVSVCAINTSRGIATWQDMLTKKTLIGASGAGADSDVFPIVLRNLFQLPMRVVTGYPGGSDLNLAMERGEIDGRCGWSWTSIVSRNRDWLASKRIQITLQIALAKHEDLPDVPLIMDLVADPRRDAALKLIVSRQSIARPFAAPHRGAGGARRDAAPSFRRHHARSGFPRRDAQPDPGGAPGQRCRGAEPDAGHLRVAAGRREASAGNPGRYAVTHRRSRAMR